MGNKMVPVHPGEVLKEELQGLNISASVFAKDLSVPTNRITAILNKKRRITSDTALRLSRYFGTSAEFWMNLQQAYDLNIASAWPETHPSDFVTAKFCNPHVSELSGFKILFPCIRASLRPITVFGQALLIFT